MNLSPFWVTGFTDGEGTFYVGINKNPTMKIGYQVLPEFRIVQHEKDVKLLYALKNFFQGGVVRVNHDNRLELRIRSIDSLNKNVIPHFDKFPLNTQKKFDFLKFKKIIDLINQGKHLERAGLINILEIAALMNRQDKIKANAILVGLKNDKI
jgi:hypothetical protein